MSFSTEFLAKQKTVLEALLARVDGSAQRAAVNSENENLLSSKSTDDIGAAISEAELAMDMLDKGIQKRREISTALDKIRRGTYGLCEMTGEPIGEERLEAIPWARFSMKAQMEIESSTVRQKRGLGAFDDSSTPQETDEES
jgi:DnaK suppressor protein